MSETSAAIDELDSSVFSLREAIDDIGAVLSAEQQVQTALQVIAISERLPIAVTERARAIVMAWAKGPVPT